VGKMSFNQDHDISDNIAGSRFTHVINHINAGIWEFNISTGGVNWSDGFYKLLGYAPGEIECSYNYFYEHILYHGDRKLFSKSTNERSPGNPATVQVRLLTKDQGYQWFENTSWRIEEGVNAKIYGAIVNIHIYKLAELEAEHKDLLFSETGKIAKLALWEIDVNVMGLSLSAEGYDIFELNSQVKLSIEEMVSFFEPEHRQEIKLAIDNIIKLCKPFDLELPFCTAKNRLTWVKVKALPIIDNYGRCIRVRGILQDIDHVKKNQAILQASLDLTNDQNKRLQNFAYIVSHNLRSHTGNLKFMVDLFKQNEHKNEQDEIFEHIYAISENLNTTVKHLEEIVKIQVETNKDKKLVEFEPLFKNIVYALAGNIKDVDANVEYDFSGLPAVNYIPAYLESILHNLLTNSLKYYQPGKIPVIKCTTFERDRHAYLTFEDNGMGIDLKRFGDQVFGMYKTFHHNPDAKGIGLFITRNQIESLGGSISVESTVNVGTKFTIRLN
jgi:signal transduction histidine kinase